MNQMSPFDARAYYYYYGGAGSAFRRVGGGSLWIPSGIELITDAAWSGTGAAISADSATAVNGTVTAETVTESTAAAPHGAFSTVTMSSGSRTAEAWLKAGERTNAAVSIVDTAGNRYAANFELVAGLATATDSVGSPVSPVNGSFSYPSGWFRCFVTVTNSTAGSGFIQFGMSNSSAPTWNSNLPTYTGDGASRIFVWGGRVT